jgi:DNA-binding transcriptional LysR family regulator
VQLLIYQHEPAEASALLATDEIDLALTYDYDLAPIAFDATVEATQLWSVAWSLGTPQQPQPQVAGNALAVFERFRDHDWIVNSRNTADEDVVRTVASVAGFEPRIAHRADSLELVEDLILAAGGVALMPADRGDVARHRSLAPHRARRQAAGLRRHTAGTCRLASPRAGLEAPDNPVDDPQSARCHGVTRA